MPTESGVIRKPAYGGAEISLFSVDNSASQSGSISGSQETIITWSISWTENGFTDRGWYYEIHGIHIPIGGAAEFVQMSVANKASAAEYWSTRRPECASYVETTSTS